MAKRLVNYKAAAAYVDEMGCGRCHHTPTKVEGGQTVPIMRTIADGPDQALMFWRLSHADVDKLKEVLNRFQVSGYRVVTPPDKTLDGTLLGHMPGQPGVFYFDVQFEYEEGGRGEKPRVVLVRGASDKPEKPEKVKA